MWKRKSCRGLKLPPSSLPSQAGPLSPPQPLAPWHGHNARHKDSDKVKKLLPDAHLTHTSHPTVTHPAASRMLLPHQRQEPQPCSSHGASAPHLQVRIVRAKSEGKKGRDSLSWEWRSSFPSESLSQGLMQATRQGAARRTGRCRPLAAPGHSITL